MQANARFKTRLLLLAVQDIFGVFSINEANEIKQNKKAFKITRLGF